MSYRPQVKQPNGQMVDIPLDAETVKGNDVSAKINNIISGAQVVGNATNDGQGNNIAATYATKSELAEAGQFDPNGTYPNLTAGNATNAGHATTADSATNAASADYATSAGSASTATNATHATSADSATKATQDGQGRNIASTYALKSEVGAKKYLHLVYIPTDSQADSDSFNGIVKIINDSSTAFTTTTLQQFLKGKAVEARGVFAEYKQPLDYVYEAFLIKGNANNFTVYGGLSTIYEPKSQPSGSRIYSSVNIEYSRISYLFMDKVTEL